MKSNANLHDVINITVAVGLLHSILKERRQKKSTQKPEYKMLNIDLKHRSYVAKSNTYINVFKQKMGCSKYDQILF